MEEFITDAELWKQNANALPPPAHPGLTSSAKKLVEHIRQATANVSEARKQQQLQHREEALFDTSVLNYRHVPTGSSIGSSSLSLPPPLESGPAIAAAKPAAPKKKKTPVPTPTVSPQEIFTNYNTASTSVRPTLSSVPSPHSYSSSSSSSSSSTNPNQALMVDIVSHLPPTKLASVLKELSKAVASSSLPVKAAKKKPSAAPKKPKAPAKPKKSAAEKKAANTAKVNNAAMKVQKAALKVQKEHLKQQEKQLKAHATALAKLAKEMKK